MSIEEKERFYAYLSKQEKIWTIAKLHGKWDLAFFVGIRNNSEFQEIWQEIEGKYKNRIDEYKIAIYSPIHNFNKKFFTDTLTDSVHRTSGGNARIPFDELDEKIVHEYGKNVRIPLQLIAKKLRVSIETVRSRIKRLEQKKVIVGYKIDPELAKIGMQGYRVDFYLNSTKRNKELFTYLKSHHYFYQINDSIGGADFETEIVVHSLVHLLEELEKITTRFKDTIRKYEYFGYTGFPTLSIIPD